MLALNALNTQVIHQYVVKVFNLLAQVLVFFHVKHNLIYCIAALFLIQIIFIVPDDCNSYISCFSRQLGSELYTCPPSYVFSTETYTCSIDQSKCSLVECEEFGVPFPYPANHGYYVNCTETEKIMYKCPDHHTQVFDPVSQECQPAMKIAY